MRSASSTSMMLWLFAEAERKSQSIIDVLVAERIADPGYLGDLLARALGVPRVNFAAQPIDKNLVAMLPEEIARQRQAIVVGQESDGVIDVAMLDPSDLETIEFLSQRFKARNRPFLAT